jgi:CSLREA domain-containing protein
VKNLHSFWKLMAATSLFLLLVAPTTKASEQLAPAAVITVNSFDDELNNDGDCSLREAIQAANLDTQIDQCIGTFGSLNDDTINLPPGTFTLTLLGDNENGNLTGDLDITDTTGKTTITGHSAATTIINGNDIDRVFDIQGSVTFALNNLTVSNGLADYGAESGGGMLARSNAIVTVNNAIFSDNDATFEGGGIYNGDSAFNDMTVENSTFVNNTAAINGGGIQNNLNASLTVINSTFSNNWGTRDAGGGIFSNGYLHLINSTLTGNGAGRNGGDNLYIINSATLDNSIIANGLTIRSDCAAPGATVTRRHTLIEDGTCSSTFTGDPVLAPLADNGGSTPTHALLPGSPAIDAGDNTTCITTDQRGIARHDGNGDGTVTCDVGAYEAGTMQCGVSSGSAYTFSAQSDVAVAVNGGTDLGCLYVDEVPANHPHATGSTDGQNLQTSKYWFVEAFQADGVTPAADFNVDLTLPYANASNTTWACKWLDGAGPGYGWNCVDGVMPTSHSPGVSVTRQNITDLSQWAVGDNVGPTAVSLQQFSPQTPVIYYLLTGLFILLCVGISVTYFYIHKQEGTNYAENLQRELP